MAGWLGYALDPHQVHGLCVVPLAAQISRVQCSGLLMFKEKKRKKKKKEGQKKKGKHEKRKIKGGKRKKEKNSLSHLPSLLLIFKFH